MTLKYMQGFETCADDSDFRSQGWFVAPVKMQSGFTPSFTGISGSSLRIIGPGSSNTTTPGADGAQDLGYYNTGITVNQAWQAGGISLGFAGRFNSGVAASYGAGQAGAPLQMCFDGTLYWSIRLIGSTYAVVSSPDLINWTAVSSQPFSVGANASITYLGSGVVAVGVQSGTTSAVWFTSNNGASWTQQNLGTSSGTTFITATFATGNSSYPHVVISSGVRNASNPSGYFIHVGTLGVSMTQVYTTTASVTAVNVGWTRIISGLLVTLGSQGTTARISTATANSASLNTAGAWSTATGTGVPTDIAYNATSNLWVVSTTSGISTIPNSGAAGTPVALSGAVTLTSRYSTAGIQALYTVGSAIFGVGALGHIVSSVDGGITWVESGGHILPVGTSGTDWRGAIYDGSRYVIWSDATNGVIVTTPDLTNNYQAQYVMDGTESTFSTASWAPTIAIHPSANNVTSGTWGLTGQVGVLKINNASGGSRTIYQGYNGTSTNLPASVSTTPAWHTFEIVITAGPTTNQFRTSIYVDGQLYISDATYYAAADTTDTTSVFMVWFARSGALSAIDDIRITLQDGVGNVAPMGTVNIVALRPSTDVQAQWVKDGTEASNALAVRSTALSSYPTTTNYVNTSTDGAKDIYATADTLPAGYKVKAAHVEAYFSKSGSNSPVCQVGLRSNTSETTSAAVTIASTAYTYVGQIVENDPNGNVAWTPSNLLASHITVAKPG